MNNDTSLPEEKIPEEFEEWIAQWLRANVITFPSDKEDMDVTLDRHNAKTTWARAIAYAAYFHLKGEGGKGTEPGMRWVKASERLIGNLNEYIALISAELDELVGHAAVNGWRSTRFEAGKALRERIAKCVEEANSISLESIPSSLSDGEVNNKNTDNE